MPSKKKTAKSTSKNAKKIKSSKKKKSGKGSKKRKNASKDKKRIAKRKTKKQEAQKKEPMEKEELVQKEVESKKTLQDFLREVIGIVAGRQSEEIVDLLDIKRYTNEFLIAKKLDITINQTRNILYKIADHGLVSSIREKDKKKGWYTYFWKIEALRALDFLKKKVEHNIFQTENQIKSREENQFYVCNRCNIELKEENALLYDFTCQECGAIFELKDNSKLLRGLKRNLNSYKAELRGIEEEIETERVRLDKKRERAIKRRKRERKLKRRRTIAKKKAAKEKEETKEQGKKKTKKTKSKKKSNKKSKTSKKKSTKKKASRKKAVSKKPSKKKGKKSSKKKTKKTKSKKKSNKKSRKKKTKKKGK